MPPRRTWVAAAWLLLALAPRPAGGLTPDDPAAPCHRCHNQPGNDPVGEWRASPYSQTEGGRTCAGCHGARCSGSGAVAPARSAGSAARLRVAAVCSGVEVEAEVAVTNLGAGHALPTGRWDRTLVLEVSAHAEDGRLLPLARPAGIDPSAHVARRTFVRDPADDNRGHSRSRLAPFETDVSRYRFAAPDHGPARVTARLLLLRAGDDPREIARAAGSCDSFAEGRLP